MQRGYNPQSDNSDSADVTATESNQPLQRAANGLLAPTLRTVLILSAPAILEQVIQAAVGVTDTVVAGHLPGDDHTVAAASAAVGVMSYLQWLAGLLNSAFSIGAMAIVARSIGAGRIRVANRVTGTAVAAAFLVSLAVGILLFVFASPVAYAIGLRDLAHRFGVQYLQIMTITIALQGVALTGMACLRGAGDTFRPMLVTSSIAIVNIITSTSFTFGWLGMPAWGLRGNAFGTMLAYLLGGVATLVLLLGGWSHLHLRWSHLRIVPHNFVRLLRIGMPSWAEGMLLWLGQILIVIFVINRNDADLGVAGATMAAHNAVIRIESLAYLPGFGFGIACSSMVGRYLGAGRQDYAKRAALLSTRLAVGTMTALAIPMVLIPHALLALMVDSAPVVAAGVWPMVLAGLAQPGFALSIIKGSGLKGAGDTVWPMIATGAGMTLVRVPVLLLALGLFARAGQPGTGLIAVWFGIFADLNFRGLINWAVWRRGSWMRKAI